MEINRGLEPISAGIEPNLYDPEKTPWSMIRADILGIEKANFGDEAFEEELLESQLTFPASVVVLSQTGPERRVVGYTYTLPVQIVYDEGPAEGQPERIIRPNTAYIVNTAIHPDFQKRHLLGPMMSLLEKELIRRGYTHIERDSAVANDFAANIAKHYGDRVEEREAHDSEFGPQVYFRIRLAQ